MLVKVTNEFHNTEVTVNTTILEKHLEHWRLTGNSTRYMRRMEKRLCGDENCVCGGVIGQRGKQSKVVEALLDGY